MLPYRFESLIRSVRMPNVTFYRCYEGRPSIWHSESATFQVVYDLKSAWQHWIVAVLYRWLNEGCFPIFRLMPIPSPMKIHLYPNMSSTEQRLQDEQMIEMTSTMVDGNLLFNVTVNFCRFFCPLWSLTPHFVFIVCSPHWFPRIGRPLQNLFPFSS